MASERRRFPQIVGPLLLVSLGALLLLNNLGWVPWSIWHDVWPFWPVLLILLGLEALVTHRVSWGGLVLTALVATVGGAIVGASAFFDGPKTIGTPVGTPTTEFRQELAGATRAVVRIRYGAGTLQVGPLQDGQLLADGSLYRAGGDLDVRYQVRDGVGELLVQPRGDRRGFRGFDSEGERLTLRLSTAVPLELRLEAGAANAFLDLRDLQLSDLRIETGASRATIQLPSTGQVRATIDGGATALNLVVPSNVAARIVVDQGLSAISIDEQRFPRQGNEYRSPNYDSAPDRLDLRISVGAARVDVQ